MSQELYTTHQRNMGMGKLLRRQQEMFREMGKLQRQTEDNEDEVAEPTETENEPDPQIEIDSEDGFAIKLPRRKDGQ